MRIKERRSRAIAAGAAAGLVAVALVAAPAEAAEVKTVKVKVTATSITFTGGGAETADGVTTLRSGRYRFHVVSPSGSHAFQLLRFREGYTAEQAQQDFQTAFQGDVAAVQRIDTGVVFLGGASARPKQPGDMVVKLRAGQYMAVDPNGDAVAMLNFVGTAPKQPKVAYRGTYTAFTHGWGLTRDLPASGMVRLYNQSDQPHFLVLQQVKSTTTNRQVRRFINSGMQGQPKWALKASADSGVVSPGRSQLFRYDLPPGKYLIACFWPDYFTGMPHVAMGMWKLVKIS
jgi:hypothetical protein